MSNRDIFNHLGQSTRFINHFRHPMDHSHEMNSRLNEDLNSMGINRPTPPIDQTRNINLRLLKPQTQRPGDIVIHQQPDVQLAPSPPLHIRQQTHLPAQHQPPMIIRERPPTVSPPLPEKHIILPGRVLPPPSFTDQSKHFQSSAQYSSPHWYERDDFSGHVNRNRNYETNRYLREPMKGGFECKCRQCQHLAHRDFISPDGIIYFTCIFPNFIKLLNTLN
jgi:hypothetical protein